MSHKKKDKNRNPLKRVMKYLPPNYGVGTIYVNGAEAPVANWVTKKDGLGYFINGEAAVSLFNAEKIDGMAFGAAEAAEPEEEEEA
jgi:hypothetical protein